MASALRAALIPILPDMEAPLAKVAASTGFLQGGISDYGFAMIIALLFPLFRYILDKTVYDVSSSYRGSRYACNYASNPIP